MPFASHDTCRCPPAQCVFIVCNERAIVTQKSRVVGGLPFLTSPRLVKPVLGLRLFFQRLLSCNTVAVPPWPLTMPLSRDNDLARRLALRLTRISTDVGSTALSEQSLSPVIMHPLTTSDATTSITASSTSAIVRAYRL